MRLTSESPRARRTILAVTWALVAALLLLHARAVRDHHALLDQQGLRGAPAAPTPMQHTVPLIYSDAQMWVLHALDLREHGGARVRFTEADNAPFGREVHWSSLLTWVILGAGELRHAATGEALSLATERALPWINCALLFVLAAAFSAWAARRAGAAAGVLVACGMIGHPDFYDGFSPHYVDHHGLITTAVFGLVLGVVFMGAGWWRAPAAGETTARLPASRRSARRAAIVSALCGGAGLWLSAASVIPAIAIAGLAGLGAAVGGAAGARQAGVEFDAGLWRLWGRVGAAAAVFFYLLEYAPSHLGLRLEVNHPLYALAWWGGAELIALLAEWRLASPAERKFSARCWLPPVLAVAAAPVALLAGGVAVFAVRDPFVGRLSSHVLEGMSLPALVQATGWKIFFLHVNETLLPAVAALGLLLARGPRERVVLGFALFALLGFVALACWEVRFWQNTAGPQLCVTLVALAALLPRGSARGRWLLVGGTVAALFLPAMLTRVRDVREKIRSRTASRLELTPARHRDLAAALRASQPTGELVLLACPTTSAGVSYYGRFQTIGTLFWENSAGLRAAAEIFSATSETEARARLRERHVTHIALTSEEDFLREYFTLLRPDAPAADFERTFGHQLFVRQQIPPWLRVLPYAPPPDLRWPGIRTLLLQIVPEQSGPEALYHIAAAQLANGETGPAEENLRTALAGTPTVNQAEFALAAGNLCYQHGARAAAARLYRAGFAHGAGVTLAANLAWLLATDRDEAVRSGTEALPLARRAAELRPDDIGAVNALAAALAETGNFPAAAAAAAHALDLVRAAGDKNSEAVFATRLAAYRAGQPWRQ